MNISNQRTYAEQIKYAPFENELLILKHPDV